MTEPALACLTGRDPAGRPVGPAPAALGQKFDAAGRPLACPGNTFLCHLDPAGPMHRALVRAQAAMQAATAGLPEARAFAWLPPESFHMTVFEGVIVLAGVPAGFPAWADPAAGVEAVTQGLVPRVAALPLPPRFRLAPVRLFGGFSLWLRGADAAAEADLRAARQALRAATGIAPADFDGYGFHVTLGYPLRWLDPGEAARVLAAAEAAGAALAAQCPGFALGPVEFCRFETMHRFDPLLRIGAGA